MRVLVVTHNYPRFSGDPAGAYIARLAEAVAAAGVEVRVLAPHTKGTAERQSSGTVLIDRFRYAPIFLERVGYRGDVSGALRHPLTLTMAPFYLARFRRAARRIATQFAPSVVHAHWWFPGGWVVEGLDLPYIVTAHGSDVRLFDRGAFWRRLGRGVLAAADAVSVASRFLGEDIERHIGPLRIPFTLTPMPVNEASFQRGRAVAKAEPARILFAGNLVPSKGVDLVLKALAILRNRGVACRVRILGEGPATRALQSLATDLRVAGDVDWSPFVSQERMPEEYGASTVTVLPSRGQAEGLGLTLVEALLAGSAVVGTPAGGIPEVIEDGVTGLLARDGDPESLADQLGRLLTDRELRTQLTAAGCARALDRYSTAAAARRFLTLYAAVTDRHATR